MYPLTIGEPEIPGQAFYQSLIETNRGCVWLRPKVCAATRIAHGVLEALWPEQCAWLWRISGLVETEDSEYDKVAV